MRISVFVFSVVVALSIANLAQNAPKETKAEHVVQAVLTRASDPLFTSSDEKGLSRLGDASVVELTKLLGESDVSVGQINQILLIITLSFEAPNIIEDPSNRQPRATLFVLKYLDSLPMDSESKGKVARTRALLQASGFNGGGPINEKR